MAKPQATASGHRRNCALGFLFLVEMVGEPVGGSCLAAAGEVVDAGEGDCGADAQLLMFCGLSLRAILLSLQCAGWADHRVAGGGLSGSASTLKRFIDIAPLSSKFKRGRCCFWKRAQCHP